MTLHFSFYSYPVTDDAWLLFNKTGVDQFQQDRSTTYGTTSNPQYARTNGIIMTKFILNNKRARENEEHQQIFLEK